MVWWPSRKGPKRSQYIHRIVMSEKLGRVLLTNEHVHHKNGDRGNWKLRNLELLTAAVHAKHHRSNEHEACHFDTSCDFCGKVISRELSQKRYYKTFCDNVCRVAGMDKIKWPAPERLKKLVWKLPVTIIAEQLGVSDTAVKKRCKREGIETPGRGYWTKETIRAERECGVRRAQPSQPTAPHGQPGPYRRGCRCSLCRRGHRLRQASWREKQCRDGQI